MGTAQWASIDEALALGWLIGPADTVPHKARHDCWGVRSHRQRDSTQQLSRVGGVFGFSWQKNQLRGRYEENAAAVPGGIDLHATVISRSVKRASVGA